ncbi:hypothetical protein GCM10020295_19130 [Streptomyces cinereospinus]
MQDLQEAGAAQGREAVARGGVAYAPVHDVDAVPADEVPSQGLVDHRIGVFDAAEGLVGEDHAEAEGVVGGVALPEDDLAAGVEAFEEGRGVQAAGAAADDRDAAPRAEGGRAHRPRHFGGLFCVNAAWNSA